MLEHLSNFLMSSDNEYAYHAKHIAPKSLGDLEIIYAAYDRNDESLYEPRMTHRRGIQFDKR